MLINEEGAEAPGPGAAALLADGKRRVIAEPGRAEVYVGAARAHSDMNDQAGGARALTRSLLISRPALEAVRMSLERLMHYPNGRPMSLLWRMAEEARSYPHEELLEREVAARPSLSDAERRNYLHYLFRRPDFLRDSLPYVVCGMPKSASTFVSGLVSEMTGLPIDDPHNYNDFIGTAMDKGCLWDLCQKDAVVHGHLAAGPRTACYFRLLKVRPIITVRNIFDALRSYVDHAYPSAQGEGPVRAAVLDHAILRMGAFYVEFYASWQRARRQFDTLWVDYEELRRDPIGLVERIAAHLGDGVVPGGLDRARSLAAPGGLDETRKQALLFNRGVPGRGRDFDDRRRALVRAMYTLYPGVDFQPIDPDLHAKS